jgi:hypothetical protein
MPLITGLEAAAVTTQLQSGKIPQQTWTDLDKPDDWDDPDFVCSLDNSI